MKTKTNLLLLCAYLLLSLTACEKNTPDPVDQQTPAEQILTAKTWKYNEYFTNYSLTSAAVTYKIGKPNNLSNYSLNRISFKADKTYFEVTQTGDTLKGTWQLLNNDSQLEVKNPTGTYLSTLLTLNSTTLVWHDTQRNVYAHMLPSDFSQTPSITINKLAGKRWMYQEYFTDFSLPGTGLAYKRDKVNNFMDLSKNRVQFNADGSVIEIDETGASVPGTWKFISIGSEVATEVSNYRGVFRSALVHLDDSSLVWYDPVSNRYAKMTLAPNEGTTTVSARAKLLTNKPWIYTELFTNYTNPLAYLSYKRDKTSGNSLDLGPQRVVFNPDGTFTENTTATSTITGTWQLLDNDTKLKITSSISTNTSNIIQLDSTSFTWYDSTNNRYGKMILNPYTPNYSVTPSKLTGKTWIYYEYFTNYNSLQSSLVYKRERTTNALNLSGNSAVFYANGTFVEVTELGQTITGTWQFINGNQLYTTNSLGGAHLATVIMLNDNSYIWYNANENTYGKLVVKP